MSYNLHILRLAWFFAFVLTGLGWSYVASARVKDTSSQEATCKDIGFRPKTVAFADCVIELLERSQDPQASIKTPARSVRSIVAQSPPPSVVPSPDEQTCTQYGFKKGASDFGQCLMQLDQAKQRAQLAQQQYQLQLQQYQQQVAAYNAQQEAIKKEKDRRKWAALARFGFGMAASKSPTLSGGMADGARAMNGQSIAPPVAPLAPPAIQNYTVRMPNGNQVYCSYNSMNGYMSCR